MWKRTVLSLCQVRDTGALGNDVLRDIDDQIDDAELLPFRYLNLPGKSH
jgi:hypothetical protein